MLSVLSRLTKQGDGKKQNGPSPMSSSLQKKFSKGVDYNMKILIKGDRNVGKSCLLQRLQGGPFIEEYQSTDQIQIAPIHWKYKDTDHIIKVEVWEVVDKGRVKKKPSGSLKFENSALPPAVDEMEIPPLDATFLDVYVNANGVIMMMDITKAWTFEYVKREISTVPSDIPIIILGNHCDMHHHREVSPYQVEILVNSSRQGRGAAVRYAETSMRNGFGLRLLHKFLNIPFLQLQRTTLLNQLNVNSQEINDASKELDEFENSEGADYEAFVDKLTSKRQQETSNNSGAPRIASDKSPSIVLGGGKPIIPPNVNPLAQSMAQKKLFTPTNNVNPVLPGNNLKSSMGENANSSIEQTKPNTIVYSPTPPSSKENIDDFCAGDLDRSFLDDFSPTNKTFPSGSSNMNYGHSQNVESDSEDGGNPLVVAIQDDLESDDEDHILKVDASIKNIQITTDKQPSKVSSENNPYNSMSVDYDKKKTNIPDLTTLRGVDSHQLPEPNINVYNSNQYKIFKQPDNYTPYLENTEYDSGYELNQPMGYDSSPTWPLDTSIRRSPEGGEGNSFDMETKKDLKTKEDKKHKKSKKSSKDKEKTGREKDGDKKEKKSKEKKHRKRGSEEKLEEFLNGSDGKLDQAQEAYEAL